MTPYASEELLQWVPVGACLLAQDLTVLFWNRRLEEWTGIAADLAGGRRLDELLPRFGDAQYALRLRAVFEGGAPAVFSAHLHKGLFPSRLPDGRRRVHQTTASAVPAAEGGHHALLVVEDVTELAGRVADHRRMRDQAVAELRERQRAEAALRASEERYRSLFEQSPTSVWRTGADGRVLDANAAVARVLGYGSPEELKGVSAADLYADPADRLPTIARLRETGSLSNVAMSMRRRDGSLIEVLMNMRLVAGAGEEMHIQGTMIDVTEQRRMEARLREAHKLQAVGRLAGGVAHEFNNLMGVVIGYGEMLLGRPRPAEETKRKVMEMVAAARRAAALTSELLRFARRETLAPRDLDLGTVVEETARFLQHLIGEHIRLETDVAPGLPPVHADRAQLEHVLASLAFNARDAMPEGGVLRIGVAADPQTGSVALTVSDTGSGMAPEVLARAFEPFFTTKAVGKGSGLGLAGVYGIVQQNGGRIAIDSAPGLGTSVLIQLPVSAEATSAAGPSPAAS